MLFSRTHISRGALFRMNVVLKLMLLKNLKTTFRSRTSISLKILLSCLLLIPVLLYKLPDINNQYFDFHDSQVSNFLNGIGDNSYTSILIMSDVNITSLNDTVMSICGVPLQIITLDDLNTFDIFGSYGYYIRVEKLSFEEPYFEYKFIKTMVCILF